MNKPEDSFSLVCYKCYKETGRAFAIVWYYCHDCRAFKLEKRIRHRFHPVMIEYYRDKFPKYE